MAIIYQLSVRRTQSAGGSGGRENEEELYEQVDDHHPGIVAMKQNAGGSGGKENEEELYEQVDDHHPGIVAMKQNEAYIRRDRHT